jgi:exodeoxyribonuclease-3
MDFTCSSTSGWPSSATSNDSHCPAKALMDASGNGYCDTFRKFCQEPGMYTWWSYRFKAREKNIGWRIDYQCVNNSFADNVLSSKILADVLGSDHCPVVVEIQD